LRISRDISRITGSSIIEKIKIDREKNEKVVKVAEKIKKAEVKVLREDKWQINKDLVLREEKVYVLKDEELKIKIIQLYYNVLVAEIGNYQWLGVIKNIRKHIDRYDLYQRIKNRTEALVKNLIINKVLERS